MHSNAKLSPTGRGVKDMPERVQRLDTDEISKAPTKMDFSTIVGQDVWAQYQSNLERVSSFMRESQELASKINSRVASAYKVLDAERLRLIKTTDFSLS